jgi:hypothetical protein
MSRQRLEYLFNQFFNKTASAEESDEFRNYLKDPGNDELLKELMQKAWEQMDDSKEFYSMGQSEEMLDKVLNTHRDEAVESPHTKRKIVYLPRVAAAAIVTGILGIGIYYWGNKNNRVPSPGQNEDMVVSAEVIPGRDKAILTSSDGSVIILDSVKDGELYVDEGTRVMKENGMIRYGNSHEKGNNIIEYHTLSTPVGGQYQILLPDGTKVWLNAASSLRFPLSFIGNKRIVDLKGEAFFEVKKKTNFPFIVKTNEELEVVVLGTSFNIMSYDDESNLITTLVEGHVNIHNGKKHMQMLPNEQVILNKSKNVLTKGEADIQETVAWKEGMFYFNNDDISSIMRKLSRWYNIEVTYKNNIPHGHYTGAIKRQSDIIKVFELLEMPGGIKFEMRNRTVIVSSK